MPAATSRQADWYWSDDPFEVQNPLCRDVGADELSMTVATNLVRLVRSKFRSVGQPKALEDPSDGFFGLDAEDGEFFMDGREDRAGNGQICDLLEMQVLDAIDAAEVAHTVRADCHRHRIQNLMFCDLFRRCRCWPCCNV